MIEAFTWILPEALAGSAQPGLMRKLEDDLAWLRECDIDHLFSLTEEPLPVEGLEGFERHHFPIPDMGIVQPRRMEEACAAILTTIRSGGRVLIHCRAGLGRTGTVGACTLVSLGLPPEAAIRQVRARSPYSIQTESQERLVHHYAGHLAALYESGTLPTLFDPPSSSNPHAVPSPWKLPAGAARDDR